MFLYKLKEMAVLDLLFMTYIKIDNLNINCYTKSCKKKRATSNFNF